MPTAPFTSTTPMLMRSASSLDEPRLDPHLEEPRVQPKASQKHGRRTGSSRLTNSAIKSTLPGNVSAVSSSKDPTSVTGKDLVPLSTTDRPDLEVATPVLVKRTVSKFKSKPNIPGLQGAAQRKYSLFCNNRTGDLYSVFWSLVGEAPAMEDAEFISGFTACAPFPGKNNARTVSGMGKDGSVMHGVVRYVYKGNMIEECRKDGREHGLRVVCTQMGDIWIRLFSDGQRLAQIVLSSDYKISSSPKPIDEGGLEALLSHLHLILECFGVQDE